MQSPLVGRSAPAFALAQVGTGSPIALDGLKGKPVVVNFWATWCVPCHEENPLLLQTAAQLRDHVQFLGIVFEDEEDRILSFLRQNGSGYPTLMDDHGKTAIAYGVGGVPETFFIDANGTIVSKFEGALTSDAIGRELRKILPEGVIR